MFKSGICTQLAGLYDAWAWHLELQQSFKNAEAVYKRGIDAVTDTEAKEGLSNRKKAFQVRVCRRLKGQEIPAEEIEEQEQRSALGRLRATGKHGKVGSVRVGSAKLGAPGSITSSQAKQPLKPNNNGGAGFKIFSDENGSTTAGTGGASAAPHSVPGRADHKENTLAPGKWNSASKGPKIANIPLDKIDMHAKPSFAVHKDEDGDSHSTVTPHKLMPGESRVLSARRLDRDTAAVHCPVALFEPPDPSKVPMYCKSKVYQGATEFSFEELRAVSWKAKEKARLQNLEMEREKMEIERKKLELIEMNKNVEEKMQMMARQMEEMKRMMVQNQQAQMNAKSQASSSGGGSSLSNSSTLFDSIHQQRAAPNDTAGLLNANPSGSGSAPSPHGRKVPNCLPSPTVNTREALAVMDQLWSTSAENDEVFVDKPPKPQFEIFCDNSSGGGSGSAPLTGPSQAPQPPFKIFSDDKENDENCPPPGFMQPPNHRETAGVLTPAINVEWVPLEDQERLLDEDEKMQEEQCRNRNANSGGLLPRPVISNETMLIPDASEFEQMAKLSSTPFNGRSFVPFEDENTCAVEIAYKKVMDDSMVMPPPPVNQPAAPNGGGGGNTVPLSPIVETSREHYKSSSSSSSGAETTHYTTRGEHSKSHWGTTGTTTYHKTADSTHGLGLSLGNTRTPGNGLLSACGSGYIGDRSGMSSQRINKQSLVNRNEPVAVTAEEFGKRMETVSADDDQTGMFSDMIAEFKQTLQKPESGPMVQQQLDHSLNPSFLETEARAEAWNTSACPASNLTTAADQSRSAAVLGTTMSGNPLAACLDATSNPGAVPQLEMTGAPALDMTGGLVNRFSPHLASNARNNVLEHTSVGKAPGLDLTSVPPALDLTNAPMINTTNAVEALDLSADDQVQEVDVDSFNPFSESCQHQLLSRVSVPVDQRHGFVR